MAITFRNKDGLHLMNEDSKAWVFSEKVTLTSDNFESAESAYSHTVKYTLSGYLEEPAIFLHEEYDASVDFSESLLSYNTYVVDSLANNGGDVWTLRLSFQKFLSTPGDGVYFPGAVVNVSTNMSSAASLTLYIFKRISSISSDSTFTVRDSNGAPSIDASQNLLKVRYLHNSKTFGDHSVNRGFESNRIAGSILRLDSEVSGPVSMGTYSSTHRSQLKTAYSDLGLNVPDSAVDALASGGTLGIDKPAIRLRVRPEISVNMPLLVSIARVPSSGVNISWPAPSPPGTDWWPIDQYYDSYEPSAVPEMDDIVRTYEFANSDYVDISQSYFFYSYELWLQERRPFISIGACTAVEGWLPVKSRQLASKDPWAAQMAPPIVASTDYTGDGFIDYRDSQYLLAVIIYNGYLEGACNILPKLTFDDKSWSSEGSSLYMIIDGADYD